MPDAHNLSADGPDVCGLKRLPYSHGFINIDHIWDRTRFEWHALRVAGSLSVHKTFLKRLQALLPTNCRPIFVTDAGFRSTWFKLLDSMSYSWIGRIRNRDMIRPQTPYGQWCGCKVLYPLANSRAQDLGAYHYVRQHPVPCRLVLVRRRSANRHHRTVHGKRTRSAHSLKQAKSNKEPWLLAASADLGELTANEIVAIYAGRMQIEQTFRDTKNERWGLGLTNSQTRRQDRLECLLLIGALACYALWVIGITAKYAGYRVEYGSKRKAASALSILSLARWWIDEFPDLHIPPGLVTDALDILASMAECSSK
ncbi:MAG: IS4 family transposase [Burkholderiaceae bacterium]|nr:IS4 family transposase [Burkholderiaceae bacterium]